MAEKKKCKCNEENTCQCNKEEVKTECSCGDNCSCDSDCTCGDDCTCGETCACEEETAPEVDPKDEQIASLQDEIAKTKDTMLRTVAEYDNYRKRATKEKEASFNNGVTHALTQILNIVDTLDMAANAPTTDEEYKKGVVLTQKKFGDIMNGLGVTELEALGKEFDPNFHSAVVQQPATEEYPAGTVCMVYQKGYMLGDKVIRHAMVVVAE